jgi:hypothetical protein
VKWLSGGSRQTMQSLIRVDRAHRQLRGGRLLQLARLLPAGERSRA